MLEVGRGGSRGERRGWLVLEAVRREDGLGRLRGEGREKETREEKTRGRQFGEGTRAESDEKEQRAGEGNSQFFM